MPGRCRIGLSILSMVMILYRRRRFINHLLTYLLMDKVGLIKIGL